MAAKMAAASFLITYQGRDYTWCPAKSTPSVGKPITELSEIVKILKKRKAKSIVDFGAGRGRNLRIIASSFTKVRLVEQGRNIAYLRGLIAKRKAASVTVESWQ